MTRSTVVSYVVTAIALAVASLAACAKKEPGKAVKETRTDGTVRVSSGTTATAQTDRSAVLSRVSDPRIKYLRVNDKGYEEYLWLKDSSIVIRIPAGTFPMGSEYGDSDERPVRDVYLNEYFMDKHEVTNRQYRRFCDATGRSYPREVDSYRTSAPNYFTRGPDCPVVMVSHSDATSYAHWVGKSLPSEAQWEKAARGPTGLPYPWGDRRGSGVRCNFADKHLGSYGDPTVDDGYEFTAPVGQFPLDASPYGCMDMAGNVSEYCTDKYDPKYYSTGPDTNPVCTAVPFETGPVIRGGTWCCSGELLRSANRNYGASFLDGWADAGFRCAVTR